MGSTPPSAGVTPAPSIHTKRGCGTEFTLSTRRVLVRRFWGKSGAGKLTRRALPPFCDLPASRHYDDLNRTLEPRRVSRARPKFYARAIVSRGRIRSAAAMIRPSCRVQHQTDQHCNMKLFRWVHTRSECTAPRLLKLMVWPTSRNARDFWCKLRTVCARYGFTSLTTSYNFCN